MGLAWPVGLAASWLEGKRAANRRRNVTGTSSGCVGGGSIGWPIGHGGARAMERRAGPWRFMALTKPCAGEHGSPSWKFGSRLLFVLKAGTGATAYRDC